MSVDDYLNLLVRFEQYNKQLLEEATELYDDIEKSKYSFLLSKNLKTIDKKKLLEAGYYFEEKFNAFTLKDLNTIRYKYQEIQSYLDDLQRFESNIDTAKYKQYNKHLVTIYKLKTVLIDRLPTRFKSYLDKQKINGESHLFMIKLLMEEKERDVLTFINIKTTNDLVEAFDKSLTNYNVMKSLQFHIVHTFNKYHLPMMKNQWKIPLYSNQVLNLLDCKLLDTTKNVESDVAICDYKKTSKYLVLKCAKINNNEYDVLFHEFVVGSLLNKLRSDTNNFCFTFFGFFCTPFNQGIEEMCKISDNDYALSTIVTTEYCGKTTLYEFFKVATVQQQYATLLQILCSLCIAQEKYKFVHGDLHSHNVFVRKLTDTLNFKYNLNEIGVIMNVNAMFLPQIIHYGRTIMKVENTLLLPFFVVDKPQIQHNVQQVLQLEKIEDFVVSQGLFVSSFDWLRLLISLRNVINLQVLQIFTKVYYSNIKKRDTTFTRWLQTVHHSKQQNMTTSNFDLTFHEDLEMCLINLHDVVLSLPK
jgi:hypothetical protein